MSIDAARRIVESCDQALSNEWDRSNSGFEAMREDAMDVEEWISSLQSVLFNLLQCIWIDDDGDYHIVITKESNPVIDAWELLGD